MSEQLHTPPAAGPQPAAAPTRYRWTIAWMLSLGVIVNYVDRANFATAVPTMSKELNFGVVEIGLLTSIWAWGYVAAMVPGSWLADRWGVRKSYTAFAGGWGIVQAATGAVSTVPALAWLRALLGVGEAPSFPMNASVAGKWFGVEERALGVAVYDSGAKLGQVIGPLLATLILVTLDWRWSFYITGAMAVAWAVGWYALYRDPWHADRHRAEVEKITAEGAQTDPGAPRSLRSYYSAWLALFGNSNTWALSIGNFAYIFASYIWFTFLPTILRTQYGVQVVATGFLTALPFLMSWFAELTAAWYMNRLIRGGWDVTRTRKGFAIVGLLVTSVAALIFVFPGLTAFVVLVVISNIGVGIAAPALWSLPADLAPQGMGASLAGIMNTIGFTGAIIGPVLTGLVLASTGSTGLVVLITGAVLVVAAVVMAVWVHGADAPIAVDG